MDPVRAARSGNRKGVVCPMADEAIVRLRKLLRDLFTARYQGVDGMRASRAQGYADGYMAAAKMALISSCDACIGLVSPHASLSALVARVGKSLA